MTMSRTIFLFSPWVTRRTFCDLAWASISAYWYCIILRIIVLYYTVSWGGGCVPRICPNSCDLARVKSTERRALILGSPRFCKQSRASPTAVFESKKLRWYAEPNHESNKRFICLSERRPVFQFIGSTLLNATDLTDGTFGVVYV